MVLNKIRDLDIATSSFNYSKEIVHDVNYSKWVDFINSNKSYFIWEEETQRGKEVLKNIEKLPDWVREGRLKGLNRKNALAEFDDKNDCYSFRVSYSEENKRIRVAFEKTPTIEQIKLLYRMANQINALLLKDGTEIIDEKIISDL